MVSLSESPGKKNSLPLLGSLLFCSKGFRDNEFLWFGQPTVEMRIKGEEDWKYEREGLRCLSSQHTGR